MKTLRSSREWHKKNTISDSVNPLESIEEEKREPKKPIMHSLTTPDIDKDLKTRIEKDIDKEYTFLLNLLLMSREHELTNDP